MSWNEMAKSRCRFDDEDMDVPCITCGHHYSDLPTAMKLLERAMDLLSSVYSFEANKEWERRYAELVRDVEKD
jgi:uncharacterized membrane protein (DUF485 family)